MNIQSELLTGLTVEEKEEVKRLWTLHNLLSAAQRRVLEKRLNRMLISKEADYNISNWPMWRADQDGYVRALTDVLKLIPDQR